MRLPKHRVALLAIGLGVVTVWVAALIGNWQTAIASVATLQGVTLAGLVYAGRRQQRGLQDQLKAQRRQARQQEQTLRNLRETIRSIERTNRHLANMDKRLTAAHEGTRVDVADIAAHLRRNS